MTTNQVSGIHHVTALAKDPNENVRFYTRILGQRLVKKTVNFDDPGTYHFYFGDRLGRPGTLMTFFPHPHAAPGRDGSSEVATTLYTVPHGSLAWWRDHLRRSDVSVIEGEAGSGGRLLFRDPDGTRLGLIEGDDARGIDPYPTQGIPQEHAIRGIDRVILAVREREPTERLLTALGYERDGGTDAHPVYRIGEGGPGERLELTIDPSLPEARLGAGSVHHVAFRVPDDAAQERIAEIIRPIVRGVTPQRDRNYFRSIYFREPGGVIFEIATDVPGFTIDEEEAELGTNLRLPPEYEHARARIESVLPQIPGAAPVDEVEEVQA